MSASGARADGDGVKPVPAMPAWLAEVRAPTRVGGNIVAFFGGGEPHVPAAAPAVEQAHRSGNLLSLSDRTGQCSEQEARALRLAWKLGRQ